MLLWCQKLVLSKIFTWFVKRLSDIQNSWLFFIYIFKQFLSSCAAEVGLSWVIIGQINARQ